MGDLVFLEYSFNPDLINPLYVYDRLDSIGFVCRSRHSTSPLEFWVQNRCIFLLRIDHALDCSGKITGIGVLTNPSVIDTFDDAYLDPESDFYRVSNMNNNFNLYLANDGLLEQHYKSVNSNYKNNSGLQTFSGAVLHSQDDSIVSLLERISSKVEESDGYKKFIFENKFSLFVKNDRDDGFTKLIAETNDVFGATAHLISKNVELLKFDSHLEGDFGTLNHKIVGYNCKAFGNSKSYSIENYIPKKDFEVDIIFRQRKQYIKIKESTLDFYDNIVYEEK